MCACARARACVRVDRYSTVNELRHARLLVHVHERVCMYYIGYRCVCVVHWCCFDTGDVDRDAPSRWDKQICSVWINNARACVCVCVSAPHWLTLRGISELRTWDFSSKKRPTLKEAGVWSEAHTVSSVCSLFSAAIQLPWIHLCMCSTLFAHLTSTQHVNTHTFYDVIWKGWTVHAEIKWNPKLKVIANSLFSHCVSVGICSKQQVNWFNSHLTVRSTKTKLTSSLYCRLVKINVESFLSWLIIITQQVNIMTWYLIMNNAVCQSNDDDIIQLSISI